MFIVVFWAVCFWLVWANITPRAMREKPTRPLRPESLAREIEVPPAST